MPLGHHDHHSLNFELQREKSDDEVQSSSPTCSSISDTKAIEEEQMMLKEFPNEVPCDLLPGLDDQCCGRSVSPGASSLKTVSSSISTVFGPLVDVVSESRSGSLVSSADGVSPQISESAKNSKEFKLNPGAKIFCPSFATPVLATAAVPAAAGVAYVTNNSPVVPVAAAAHAEVGIGAFAPPLPVPAKFAPYPSFAAVNGVDGPLFPQPIIGHMGGITQPLRYTSQFYPGFVPPNSHAVMVGNGRLGQFVYLQPVPHVRYDVSNMSRATVPPSAPPMLTSHQVQYPKHQAGQPLQLPPFTMPAPVPANPAIPLPPPHSLPTTKLQ